MSAPPPEPVIREAKLLSARGASHTPSESPAAAYVGLWIPHDNIQVREEEPSADETRKVEELKAWIDGNVRLPSNDAYAAMETRFLGSRDCYLRFLRAENGKLEKAKTRLEETLKWRREYKPDLIAPDDIQEEVEGGKVVVSGFSKEGMPLIYCRPARENTDPSPRQVQNLVFMLERAVDIMPPGVTKLVMICDFAGASARSSPPMRITKAVLAILVQHYPETLGRALVTNLPWYMKSFFSTISPFLDERTRKKLSMNPDFLALIDKDQLDAQLGGDYRFEYRHEVYLPAICDFCGIAQDGTRKDASSIAGSKRGADEISSVASSKESKPVETAKDARPALTGIAARQKTVSAPTERPPPAKRTKRKPLQRRRTLSFMCLSADAYDEEAERDVEEDTSSAEKAGPWSRLFKRKSAVQRNADHSTPSAAVDLEQTRSLERHFKAGEPIRVHESEPKIVHALEATAQEDAKDAPLATTSPPPTATVALDSAALVDPMKHALEVARQATSTEQGEIIKPPTVDHAVLITAASRPAESPMSFQTAELSFDVAKA